MSPTEFFKHMRYREEPGNKPGKVKRIPQVFLRPGKAKDGSLLRCPAGPGKRPIPAQGKWYDLTSYLWRRCACGDAVEADPKPLPLTAEVAEKPKPKKPQKGDRK